MSDYALAQFGERTLAMPARCGRARSRQVTDSRGSLRVRLGGLLVVLGRRCSPSRRRKRAAS